MSRHGASPGIGHPVITAEAQLSLQGTEGGAGLGHPTSPHMGQTHIGSSVAGALQHLAHIVIIPGALDVMPRPLIGQYIRPLIGWQSRHDPRTCCLSRTRGCSEGGSGGDSQRGLRDSPLTSEEDRRPLRWSLMSRLRERMSWTFSLIEFIHLKSLQISPKVKLKLRVFE